MNRNIVQLSIITFLQLLTDSSLWPVAVCLFLFVSQELFLLLAGRMGSPKLYRLLPSLGRLARGIWLFAVAMSLIRLVLQDLVGSSEADFGTLLLGASIPLPPPTVRTFDPDDERLGAALAFSYALRHTHAVLPRAPATLNLKDGTLVITLPSSDTLEVAAKSYADQRLAMAIARMFKDENGKRLFSFSQIAVAFGKNSRQVIQCRLLALKRVGGSLTEMQLYCRQGRPRTLEPWLEKQTASFWERDPFATPEQCHQWLSTQSQPEGKVLPSVERLARVGYIPGNLVAVRHTLRRFMERSNEPIRLRRETLVSRLFEVIDAQDRRIQELGGARVQRSGIVEALPPLNSDSILEHTRTSRALMRALSPLTTAPSEQDDLALMNQVGLKELPPLHYAALYCSLRLSIAQIAALVGHSKSVVYRSLLRFARAIKTLDLFPPAQHFSGILGLDEKWLKIPKSYSREERLDGKNWRYAHFAVDARTGDLLHVDVYESSTQESARAFFVALRAMGLRPRVVVTDIWPGYEALIREVFGERVVHHYCLFHHLQAIRNQLRKKCGKDWKQSSLLRKFVAQVDRIYDCHDRRTARKRLSELLTLRSALQEQHPEAECLLDLIEKRFPKVSNALGIKLVPTTNNVTERTIRAFNQHYKNMAGLESLETARVQLLLFRFFYRLTPQREMARKEDRNTCPVERAGWNVRGIPIADYIRKLTQALTEEDSAAHSELHQSRAPPQTPAPLRERRAA